MWCAPPVPDYPVRQSRPATLGNPAGTIYAEVYKEILANMSTPAPQGAKTPELPIEQATMFALVLNRTTANALGIKLSQELLPQAERIIR